MTDDPEAPALRYAPILGLGLIAVVGIGAWADTAFGWTPHVFDFIAHQFYEIPKLARIRRPSQLALFRVHLAISVSLAALGLLLSHRLGRHGRRLYAVLWVGYAVRATAWIVGGNLPMVSGDSPHYVEIASSILQGEGPVKHYVESFFIDYPQIRQGKGVLDDWATPLYGYALAAAYRVVGVIPGESLEATVAVDKGLSFVFNLLCLPMLYGFARRRFGRDVGLVAAALLAVLPVHVIYAGLDLRESLVALTSIAAVWFLTEVWSANGSKAWGWAVAAGLAGGSAILARNTAMALLAACGTYGLLVHRRRSLGPMFGWGAIVVAVIAPWAWATFQVYGEPFYTYTKFFQYTFSWTVHHYQAGTPKPADFYAWGNAATIARVKIKALFIIVTYSTMIFSLPLALLFLRRLFGPIRSDVDRLAGLVGLVFGAATIANIADVTQVAQLGRYYMPVFVLMLPTAAAGIIDASRDWSIPETVRPFLAATLFALLWADPTWAYDASWYVKPYQLHWPALSETGDWIKSHPDVVPRDARIMTWFPWEVRLATGRASVLMPRNFDARRIGEVIRRYGVTHVLWGSFEVPTDLDTEAFGTYLKNLRASIGLFDALELHRSPRDLLFGVRLYRVGGGIP